MRGENPTENLTHTNSPFPLWKLAERLGENVSAHDIP